MMSLWWKLHRLQNLLAYSKNIFNRELNYLKKNLNYSDV